MMCIESYGKHFDIISYHLDINYVINNPTNDKGNIFCRVVTETAFIHTCPEFFCLLYDLYHTFITSECSIKYLYNRCI